MLEQLRAWLNGKREYYAGVALLAEAGGAAPLLAVLKKGSTPFTTAKLQTELLAICNRLKAEQNGCTGLPRAQVHTSVEMPTNKAGVAGAEKKSEEPVNPALYESCRQEAIKVYKTAMNDRAILFSQANALSTEEMNLPHHVAARRSLALAVVRNYNEASRLFDRADYVKQHGRLPDSDVQEDPATLYDGLLDEQVYPELTRLRKAYSKLKQKEPIPTRVALMQQHKSNIEKLEKRWHSLNQKQ